MDITGSKISKDEDTRSRAKSNITKAVSLLNVALNDCFDLSVKPDNIIYDLSYLARHLDKIREKL